MLILAHCSTQTQADKLLTLQQQPPRFPNSKDGLGKACSTAALLQHKEMHVVPEHRADKKKPLGVKQTKQPSKLVPGWYKTPRHSKKKKKKKNAQVAIEGFGDMKASVWKQ